MSKRVDTVQIGFRWKRELYERVKTVAEQNGVTLGAYLAMIASQKQIETQAMNFLSQLPIETIKAELEKHKE